MAQIIQFLLSPISYDGDILRQGTVEFWQSSQRTTPGTVWYDAGEVDVIPLTSRVLNNEGILTAYGSDSYFIVIKDADGVERRQIYYSNFEVVSELDRLWIDVDQKYGPLAS